MKNPISKWANEAQKRNSIQQNNPLNKNLELREALAEVDRLTSENIELKDEINELLLRNEKLREICISLEIQIDDINTIVKSEMGYQIDSDEFSEAFNRLLKKGGFPKDEK
tara:strand:+ start:8191 stop:8523 length:333 start_codon:yes stop_codon:yes gene_type:complete